MKRTFWVCLSVLGLILSWTLVYAADFYVIPMKVEKQNYAPVEKTGQKDCYYDDETTGTCICGTQNCPAGQDGDFENGVAWPNPRFTDNSDGTVTDNLTGLIWMKDANCSKFYSDDTKVQNSRTWSEAFTAANSLSAGHCGLTDGSSAGDWRLPNRKELLSLIDIAYDDPALSNAAGTRKWSAGDPFNGVNSSYYWSSTTYASRTSYVWNVHFAFGLVYGVDKSVDYCHVWCVRGGN